MNKKKVLTNDQVFKILKKFTIECVHGGDFDQGNTEEQTLSILKTWWNKEQNSNNVDNQQLNISDIISRLKTDLDKWIDNCEKAAGNLRDIGHLKDAQNFDGQATAYSTVKTYLDVNYI